MTKHPISVTLSETDRASLYTFIHAGKANVCQAFDISRNTSIQVRQRY